MAIKQKSVVKMRVKGQTQGHARTDIEIRDLNVVIDEPVERGGTNLGPSPTEYAYIALVGCTTSISNKCAKHLGIDIGELSYEMSVDFDRRGVLLMEEVDLPFPSIDLQVTASGPATQEELDRVALETTKYCAVSKLFEGSGTKVNVTWSKG